METFGIGRAVDELRAGKKVTRLGWHGAGQYLQLQNPDGRSFMTLPYVFITTPTGNRVPWLCSQTDLLAADWRVVE